MKNYTDHNNEEEEWDMKQKALFEQLETPFKENMAHTWDSLLAKTYDTPQEKPLEKTLPKTKIISSIWFRVAAASLLLAMCTLGFTKFYTTSIICLDGEHFSHSLPDGSIVQLNAASSISYAPYWWNFNRTVQLKGEAFFEVKKGSRFVVESQLGSTEVLGTSFNIYARKLQYRVLCTSGKVKVTIQKFKQSLNLLPNELATLVDSRELEKSKTTEATKILAWKKNQFYFNSIPLPLVLEEMERQYNIKIEFHPVSYSPDRFTGFFEKQNDIEQVLQMLTLPFGFSFKKIKQNHYIIEKK